MTATPCTPLSSPPPGYVPDPRKPCGYLVDILMPTLHKKDGQHCGTKFLVKIVCLPCLFPLPLVVTNGTNLVIFKIPALDLLVFTTGEEVRVPVRNGHAPHSRHMACE